MIEAGFIFHPIGQGAFYSGRILDLPAMHDFNCVYDCGVMGNRAKLESEINLYKERLPRKKLDVLFLSHLDDDHVNGVAELLAGIECSKVYLPYLNPIQRLYVAIRGNDEGDGVNNFIDFIQNPHEYLLRQGQIGEIIYISGNSEGTFNSRQEIRGDENATVYDNLDPVPITELSTEMTNISTITGGKVKFKKGNGRILFRRIWEFYLYHEPAEEILIHRLIQRINILYSGIGATEELTTEQLVFILNNREQLKKLRRTFKSSFGNINRAGLLIQHKPINYRRASLFKWYKPAPFYHYFSSFYGKYYRGTSEVQSSAEDYKWGVTLLTGDIELNQLYVNVSAYILNHLDSVKVFQVPHHGSQKGWVVGHLNGLNPDGCTYAVINFGYGNHYGHPSYNVLFDLKHRNFEICFCNQFEGFNYGFVVVP